MDLARLRVFQAVADEGSFSRAARALFLSQPAITQHIHALEAELGVPLFDRLGRRTSLTPAGASLAQHVPQIMGMVRAAETAAREAGGEARRALRLRLRETLGADSLPARAFPDRRLLLRKRNSAARRVIQALLEREQAFPSDVLEMDNLEAIKRSVEVGFGISIAPRSAVVREMQAGTLRVVPLDAPDAYITSSYAQYAGRRLSAPARAFVEVLETLRR